MATGNLPLTCSGVVNSSKGWMLAWPSESDMITERRNREEYAIEIAKRKIALKDICEYTLMQYQRAEAAIQQGSASLAHGYFMAEAIKTRVIEGHSQYNASDEMVRKVEAESAKWQNNQGELYRQMLDLCSTSAMAPVDMPKGVNVSADIKSNIVKQNGKYMMQKMDLQKTVNGQYGVVQALGAKLQPVNYK